MVFSNARHVNNHVIATLTGHTIEQVKVYKYLGVWVDDKLSFTVHVENLRRKLKLKIGFYYWHKVIF
jgi:lipoate-protein ligase B